MRPPDAAEVVLGAGVAWVLAGDVWLARRRLPAGVERRLVTDVLRTPAASAGLLYLLAHVADVLGCLDVFRAAGRALTPPDPRRSDGTVVRDR